MPPSVLDFGVVNGWIRRHCRDPGRLPIAREGWGAAPLPTFEKRNPCRGKGKTGFLRLARRLSGRTPVGFVFLVFQCWSFQPYEEIIMKTPTMKNAFAAASLLFAAGQAGVASAHSLNGTLGQPVGATDLFQISCTSDSGATTGRLQLRVKDNAPSKPPLLSVRGQRLNRAVNGTDQIDGDAGYSPAVNVIGTNGVYYVTVAKTKAGAESYTLEFHCQSSTGVHTGTSYAQTQNQ
jgi:hypothetical protein